MRRKGHEMEGHARLWLEGKGWKVQGSNQRIAGVEIDLVARNPQGDPYFIEVKYRRGAFFYQHSLLTQAQWKRQLKALRASRCFFFGKEAKWALLLIKDRGVIEFIENPCYF
jgi:Holliday junction resolvase-like predicted endonuclease